jgi:hypothetical protein
LNWFFRRVIFVKLLIKFIICGLVTTSMVFSFATPTILASYGSGTLPVEQGGGGGCPSNQFCQTFWLPWGTSSGSPALETGPTFGGISYNAAWGNNQSGNRAMIGFNHINFPSELSRERCLWAPFIWRLSGANGPVPPNPRDSNGNLTQTQTNAIAHGVNQVLFHSTHYALPQKSPYWYRTDWGQVSDRLRTLRNQVNNNSSGNGWDFSHPNLVIACQIEPFTTCRPFTDTTTTPAWSYERRENGRTGWQQVLIPENPSDLSVLTNNQIDNWTQNRHAQNHMTGPENAGEGQVPVPHLPFRQWLTQTRIDEMASWVNSPGGWQNIANPTSYPSLSAARAAAQTQINNHNTELGNRYDRQWYDPADPTAGAQYARDLSEATFPPDLLLSDRNKLGLQEGALFRLTTNEQRADMFWNFRRTWTIEISGTECRHWNGSTLSDSSWTINNVRYRIASSDSSSQYRNPNQTTQINWALATTWRTVEHKQLLSARCNAEGMERAAEHGTQIIAPNVDNSFFSMVLSDAHVDLDDLPFKSLQSPDRTPPNALTRLIQESDSISFYTSTESCKNEISCVNENGTGEFGINNGSINNRRNTSSTTFPGDIPRWGANYVDPASPVRSSNSFTFGRDNQWNNIWVDLWRPSVETTTEENSWQWLNSLNSNPVSPQRHPYSAHHSQMRWAMEGTPGVAEELGGFRFNARTGNTLYTAWPIADTLPNIALQLPNTMVDEYTQFRTRASWASNFNFPHRVNLQWLYNGNIRSFAPDEIIGGDIGNRATVSTNISYEWNGIDIMCPATFNTNNPQTATIKWHKLFGRNQQEENRAIENAEFNWDDERTLRISFVRPVGE